MPFYLRALLEHLEKNIVWIVLSSSEVRIEVKRSVTNGAIPEYLLLLRAKLWC